ncbi:MAG TPA: branched-chain amino acid ABC transporter permease [Gaiellales bacterium]|nr:branched-chain amino acid ABC transporter permease [Gaiellales bacterium]
MATETHTARRPVLAVLPRVTGAVNRVLTVGLLILLAAWLLTNLVKGPSQFGAVALIGLTNGCLYALIALGYTLVYGIIELINFAHGDVFMWGTMITVTVAGTHMGLDGSQTGVITLLGVLGAMLCAMAFCATLNAGIERVALRRLRDAPRLAPLITTLGLSYVLSNAAQFFYGPNYTGIGAVLPEHVLFLNWPEKSLIVVLATIPLLGILTYIVRFTKQGRGMRAVAQDMDAARMMGVDVDRTISFTFALAGGLAGAAGTLYLLDITTTRFDLGQIGLLAFTAAVLGGIGNLTGAALGALIIGFIQAFNEGLSWHAPGEQWTTSIVFSVLILILVFRPQGILGQPEADRA